MALAIVRLPMPMAKTLPQPASHVSAVSNTSFSNVMPITTLVLSISQETSLGNDDSNNQQQLANQLTIIFGVIAAVLALGSLVFGYLAWHVYKHPGRSRLVLSPLTWLRWMVVTAVGACVQRRKKQHGYGPGSRFEDGCVEMQDAATWKYYEAINMPPSPT